MSIFSSAKRWFYKAMDNYERPLTRYSRNLLRDLEMAKEVVQEGFLRLWKNGPIEEGNPLKVWLYRTCRNLSIDILRKEGRMSLFEEDQEDKLLCPEKLPSEKLEQRQVAQDILNKIESLPDKHQEVLRLKFQEELSYKEISEITGYTVSHVGVLLHKSILHLRESYINGGQNV